jgi:hypothetical protein
MLCVLNGEFTRRNVRSFLWLLAALTSITSVFLLFFSSARWSIITLINDFRLNMYIEIHIIHSEIHNARYIHQGNQNVVTMHMLHLVFISHHSFTVFTLLTSKFSKWLIVNLIFFAWKFNITLILYIYLCMELSYIIAVISFYENLIVLVLVYWNWG